MRLSIWVYRHLLIKSISKYDTDDRGVTNEEIDTNNYNKTTKKVTELATGMMNGNVAFNFYF